MALEESEERVLGLTLAQIAGVRVALVEGHSREAVLGQESIDAAVHLAAEPVWRKRITQDAAVRERFAELVAIAEDALARAVPPLDSDERAWAGLLTLAGRAEGIATALETYGLTTGDRARLVRAWQARMVQDEALAATVRALVGRVSAPTQIKPEAPVLRPYPWSPGKPVPMAEWPTYAPWQRLTFALDGELPVERDTDAYAGLVATLEAFPAEKARALEVAGLTPPDLERSEAKWRERFKRDQAARAMFSVQLADHRAHAKNLSIT